MRYPYSSDPLDALLVAQASAGLGLASVLWQKGMRPRASNALLLAAMALSVVAPIGNAPFADNPLLHTIGTVVGAGFAKPALRLSAALASSAVLLTRRRLLAAVALAGEALLWLVTDYIQKCNADLAVLHLAFFGGLVGVHLATAPGQPGTEGRSEQHPSPAGWRDDVAAFCAGTLAAALVCRLVEHGWTSGADEWGNTFEAAVFAKLRAYGAAPPCGEEFRSYWVYQYQGRAFAQYTPGWPYFMTPFVAAGAAWLANPVATGLLAAGVMRLGRRAAGTSTARVAGRVAAAATILSATVLENGASRYPHIFVTAMFAWSLEALCAACDPAESPSRRRQWGLVLGVSTGWLVAARPLDGATLGLGLAAVFAHAAWRREVDLRAVVWASVPFGAISALTLLILRLQLGRWWTTGYSLAPLTYPWAVYGWTLPKADEFRWGLPLASGAYCFWPSSLALGLPGMALVRGSARRVGLACLVGCAALLVAYTLSEFGRWYDFGYGPRYQIPCVVPAAIGTGVLAARLWAGARARIAAARDVRTLLAGAGPVALSFGAALGGVALIAGGMYPYARLDVERHNWLRPTLDEAKLHHAVVFATTVAASHALDLCENLPLDLYPDQDVLLAIDRGDESLRCVHAAYPDRALYRGSVGPPVRIDPVSPPDSRP
jgi:hypothetical protein